jgi:hypothetical protein
VADAVEIEPVSSAGFPANREKNREKSEKRAKPEFFGKGIASEYRYLWGKFPTRTNREFRLDIREMGGLEQRIAIAQEEMPV